MDFIDFNKEDTIQNLEENYGYKRYPYKHYESIFTRFYQGYILPKKFKVDKRRLHLSTLIISNQIKREDAVQVLKNPPYNNSVELQEDINYFLKKMNWSTKKLDEYIKNPNENHSSFKNEYSFYLLLKRIYKFINKNKK